MSRVEAPAVAIRLMIDSAEIETLSLFAPFKTGHVGSLCRDSIAKRWTATLRSAAVALLFHFSTAFHKQNRIGNNILAESGSKEHDECGGVS